MKNRTRQVLASVTVTSLLSILIGGFAVWSSYKAEISIVDNHMETVITDIYSNPSDAITSALLSLDQNSFDFTLAFKTQEGALTILKESQSAIIGSNSHMIQREIGIESGEKLIIAASLTDIDRSLKKNLLGLLILIIFANAIASYISILISRAGALSLERSQREKMQEFLGDAAHELRTPLTVVKGYTELLEGKQLDSKNQDLAFSRLKSEIKRMESLIGDLLILAELGEQNIVDTEVFDLSALLHENVIDFQTLSPNRKVKIDIEDEIYLNGSEKYMRRFIQNALTNIRIHTNDNVPVTVTLHGGKHADLIIEDGGPGLPADSYGEKIQGLKRFDRSRSRETGGSGLGMSIMSAVIEWHQGDLTLRKSTLGGLAIEVTLSTNV